MATRFRYPTGVRPLLAEEAARRRRIEQRFVAMLEEAGFAEIVLPIIDYADPYASLIDRDIARQSYRFVDRDGELVAIRSDFTPMVARALAPAIDPDELPRRVYYRGDVIRCESSRLGANREMFQIGAEIVGDASVDADIDVLLLASRILRSFGIRPLVVYNDVSIAETLIARSGTATSGVRAALVSKRTSDVASLRGLVDSAALRLIENLASGSATLADVAAYAPASRPSGRLRSIGEAVSGENCSDFLLQLDDIEESGGYYTGIRFRVYCGATRVRIAQGGRYDDLYARFGAPAPAIGFTFTIDDLDGESLLTGANTARGVAEVRS